MGHEHDEFADFYRARRDSCLRAVTAVVGDRELAEEQVAEAFTRAWMSWGKVRRHAAPITMPPLRLALATPWTPR
jgi:DNA-directed RNA polymerase specialized sigma24 family protein